MSTYAAEKLAENPKQQKQHLRSDFASSAPRRRVCVDRTMMMECSCDATPPRRLSHELSRTATQGRSFVRAAPCGFSHTQTPRPVKRGHLAPLRHHKSPSTSNAGHGHALCDGGSAAQPCNVPGSDCAIRRAKGCRDACRQDTCDLRAIRLRDPCTQITAHPRTSAVLVLASRTEADMFRFVGSAKATRERLPQDGRQTEKSENKRTTNDQLKRAWRRKNNGKD